MPEKLPPHFIELLQDAVLKSFWRRSALLAFLRRHRIAASFLATWDKTESKRELLDRLFPKLESDKSGPATMKRMAGSLSDQTSFPDLKGWEDSKDKVEAAKQSVAALREYMNRKKRERKDEQAAEAVRNAAREQQQRAIASNITLAKLEDRLTQLSKRLGEQAAGYEFENWFYDLAAFYEIPSKRPYVANRRQIDGSLTLEGTTYLTELKFTAGQADANDVDSFLAKVNDMADNTMGIMVSISGYSPVAVKQASGRKSPLLLLDHGHIYLILSGAWTLPEVVDRVRRHASQTAEAYLAVAEFAK